MGRRRKQTPESAKRPKVEKRWLSLPRLEGVRWVWADNWYDGVLSGVVEYQGRRYYAVCVDENYSKRQKWFRRYLVVDLPEEVWKEEIERHNFFVEKVGSHFEFDMERQCRKGHENLKHSRTWHEFYERYPSPAMGGETRDYQQYAHVGWFENG